MSDEKSDQKKNSTEQEEQEPKTDEVIAEGVFEKLPPEVKKVMEIGFSMQRFSGPVPPFLTKINEAHISKILELAEKDDERAFADTQSSKRYILAYVLIFSVLFVFATVFLVGQNTELYKEMLKLLAMFLGGLGSGFGLKGYLDRKKE